MVALLDDGLWFPDPRKARPDGLVAVGGGWRQLVAVGGGW